MLQEWNQPEVAAGQLQWSFKLHMVPSGSLAYVRMYYFYV